MSHFMGKCGHTLLIKNQFLNHCYSGTYRHKRIDSLVNTQYVDWHKCCFQRFWSRQNFL